SVKLFFEEFLQSTQPLALPIKPASRQREAHSTALKLAVNTSFSTAFDYRGDHSKRLSNHPSEPGAFYTAFAVLQPLFLS
ncbi:hypothetical protein, partial [Pseudomonas sp.]|uniref:hypothetical protein n=1 Tax=Pseudomonas sp. TaxID=306 RepID=UPI00257BC5FF